MSDVHEHIQEAIDQLVESGAELGLQVAVYQHGSLVVDAVSGVADPATGRPVASDTPFYVTSTAKGVTSTVVHVLRWTLLPCSGWPAVAGPPPTPTPTPASPSR
jgi:CubicO group peptidase (beta-lactamase class C family)